MRRLLLATLPFVVCGASLSAQRLEDTITTPRGPCRVWSLIPGESSFPRDSARARCGLDRPPVLREGQPMPPQPWAGRGISDDIQVIVRADGSVDSALTRQWGTGSDKHFQQAMLATVRHWQFEPGRFRGRPVRSGFRLVLVAPERVDTIPSRLTWSWRRGDEVDTLSGSWHLLGPRPQLTEAQRDGLLADVLRRLVRMQVITRRFDGEICVLSARGAWDDAAARALASRVLREGASHRASLMAASGCERSSNARRLVLPAAHVTEDGRVVMNVSGDYLPHWPAGLDGRPWSAWSARCIARLSEERATALECEASPVMKQEESAAWSDASYGRRWFFDGLTRHGRPRHPDSLDVQLRVTTAGAWQVDTLARRVPRPMSIREHAVLDAEPPCGGWSAHSPQDSSVIVVHGDVESQSLQLTRAGRRAAPTGAGSGSCGSQEPRISRFAAFLLGGVGDSVVAPVSLCYYGRGGCHTLDARRHLVAAAPSVRFRIGDLRADTRMGGPLDLEVRVDEAPEGVLPIIVMRRGDWPPSAWLGRRQMLDRWDLGVWDVEALTPETEVLVYLVRR